MASFAALLALFSSPFAAHAYRTAEDLPAFAGAGRVRWTGSAPSFVINEATPDATSIAEVVVQVREAADAWHLPCATTELFYAGTTTSSALPDDGRNTVQWLRSDWRERGLTADITAITDINYAVIDDGTARISEADIFINDLDFEWHARTSNSGRNVRSVLTHEFGHFIGLLHDCEVDASDGAPRCDANPDYASAVMYPLYRAADGWYLSSDDAAGFCYLYGSSQCEASACESGVCTDAGCADVCTLRGCPPDQRCTPGGCVDARCGTCDAGSYCAPDCSPSAGQTMGGPCGSDAECLTRVCHSEGYCTAPCSRTDDCPSGWACDGTWCTPEKLHFGEACEYSDDCVTHDCVSVGSTEPRCTTACDEARRCPSGYVCGRAARGSYCVPGNAAASCAVRAAEPPTSLHAAGWISLAFVFLLIRRHRETTRQ